MAARDQRTRNAPSGAAHGDRAVARQRASPDTKPPAGARDSRILSLRETPKGVLPAAQRAFRSRHKRRKVFGTDAASHPSQRCEWILKAKLQTVQEEKHE